MKLPPGPPKLPFIGTLHQLFGPTTRSRALQDLAKKYGPIMQLQLGELPVIVISSAKYAQHVLRTHELNFAQRPIVHAVEVMPFHDSTIIFSPHNDHWRQMRKIFVSQLLCPKRVQSLQSIREKEVLRLVKSISLSEGLPINLSKKIFRMTNNIISDAICGNCQHQDTILSIVEELFRLAKGFGFYDIFPSLKFLYSISHSKHATQKLYQSLNKIFEAIIEEHKGERGLTMSSRNKELKFAQKDLVSVLLEIQEGSNLEFPLTMDDMKATLLEYFGATSIIIATVTEWAITEMVRNPRVMRKAQAEIRQVLGEGSKIDESDVKRLSYLTSIVKETLRLHPPGPLFIRESKEACQIDGYDIPAKTQVLINARVIGRDPECWSNDAETFRPERFECSSVNYFGTCLEFLPFGAGRRMCPGILFGLAIVELPLAQLLYHFDWELPEGIEPRELDMDDFDGLNPRRKNELYLRATPTM